MTALALAGVRKAFGSRTILSDISLDVASGGVLAVLGPSGSGKTTLLRLICGFERSGGGTIRLGGDLVSGDGLHVPPERRRVGYVAQDGALFPHLSVADNIVFGLPRRERRRRHRVAELLELVGLPAAYAERPPQELSGGEQQRVSRRSRGWCCWTSRFPRSMPGCGWKRGRRSRPLSARPARPPCW
jgi:iron(III) transport system ATP-binding protein